MPSLMQRRGGWWPRYLQKRIGVEGVVSYRRRVSQDRKQPPFNKQKPFVELYTTVTVKYFILELKIIKS